LTQWIDESKTSARLQKGAYAWENLLLDAQTNEQVKVAVMIDTSLLLSEALVLAEVSRRQQLEKLLNALWRALRVPVAGEKKHGNSAIA
jgi:hypothetical protein